jgi:uncharacterized membrane protein YeaQ/YmgE (transglycosylase-associated protein family)
VAAERRSVHSKDSFVNIISWVIVGGSIGWLATWVMRTDAQQGIALNLVLGVAGALLGGGLLSPLLGSVTTLNQSGFRISSLFVSVLGAIILLAAASLVPRRMAR